MVINIGGYQFEGIYYDPDDIKEESGVYVVLCVVDNVPHCILDIGTAGFSKAPRYYYVTKRSNLRRRIKYHKRKKCWEENKHGNIGFAVLYLNDEEKALNIEKELQWKFEYACGGNFWRDIEIAWGEYQEYEKKFGQRGSWKI